MWASFKKLKKQGILGINRRNTCYTLYYNQRSLLPLVDDKLRTKKLAAKAGMGVPALYAVIEIQRQVRDLHTLLTPYIDFVIKPAHGSGGDGILVCTGKREKHYRLANNNLLTQSELEHNVSNILSGMFSLGGAPDVALIEYRVQFDPIFENVSYQGVPDIRIIVFQGVPVMAMVRLPTRMSSGKANLHQGAVGAGIDISTGRTNYAVWGNDNIAVHPDTEHPVTGIRIPYWDKLLELASRCYELTGLGYQGVDIVLDRQKGPLILELNARPGLNIQIANRAGLLLRLNKVKDNIGRLKNVHERISFARQHFRSK